MRLKLLSCVLLARCCQYVQAKAVFAHFMVGNTVSFTDATWRNNFNLAIAAKIDGFALNMASRDTTNEAQLGIAFDAAAAVGFKLFFSFDYQANGMWNLEDVVALIQKFSTSSAYYTHRDTKRPLVSTFEGPILSGNWTKIKTRTNAFFMPSWNSLSPYEAIAKSGVSNGLFNWDAWPEGPSDMFTTLDTTFKAALNGKPYMMAVSPWFYANMPNYRKNWVWRSESLWYDRWNQINFLQPEYVQIISWNDFGESHYIGPLDTKQYMAFGKNFGNAPYNYAQNMPHDGWRATLPYVIEMYKNNQSTITKERLVTWYRRTSAVAPACNSNGTTGNTAAKLQTLFTPSQLVLDRIYFSALLGSPANITVSIGGVQATPVWKNSPVGGIGIYHGYAPFNIKSSGEVWLTLYRNKVKVLQLGPGLPILTTCTSGIQNYNPYVKDTVSSVTINKTPQNLKLSKCVDGIGSGKYALLCQHACRLGYCPEVCTCTMMGPKRALPLAKSLVGCPALGIDSTFTGLCRFNCDLDYCNPTYCVGKPKGSSTACTAPAPVAPKLNLCVAGTGTGDFAQLCSWTCRFGYCPPEICVCTLASIIVNPPPPAKWVPGWPLNGLFDFGLCGWSCARGNCPGNVCTNGTLVI